MRADSPFCRTLKETLRSVAIHPFQWSGKNSHSARLRAADRLAGFLNDQLAAHPHAQHHVVAHSHGGNVVLYALRDSDLRAAVASVVFLGTPFISVSRRNIDSTVAALKYAVPAGLSIPWTIAGSLFVADTVRLAAHPNFGAGAAVLAVLLFGALFTALAFLGRWWLRYVGHTLLQRLKHRQQALVDKLSLPPLDAAPLYAVRARRDEAAAYLRGLDRVASIPFRLWHPTGIAWFIASATILVVAFFAYVAFRPEGGVAKDLWESLSGLAFFIAAAPLAAALIFVLTALVFQGLMIVWTGVFRGHALGFGDRIFENWLVHVASEDRPPGGRVKDEEIALAGNGLRHSLLYQDPNVAQAVAGWLRNPV